MRINIIQEERSVETVDVTRGLKYTQRFLENLSIIEKPTITKVKTTKPYTRVSFKPDYARFGIINLSSDMISLLKKRVYDVAALTDSTSKVKMIYNKEVLPVKNFQQYVDLYIGKKDGDIGKRVYEKLNDRWEVAVSISPTQQFEQVSFVNGICTYKGGKHVDYVLGQILRKVQVYIEKKKKIVVNINTIKEQLIIFLRSDIENPNFDSQTKECMNTPSNKFGSTCTVSDEFAEKVAKLGVMDTACALSEIKESKIAKKSDGSKTRTVRGIANFVDANSAGTTQSNKCILILCEGLSAMSGVVSGLSSEDRNLIGIYPLKGKLLNVRGELVKSILGLESGKEYKSIDDVNRLLRYGKVMILTDSIAMMKRITKKTIFLI
jgi:DNA topoisomerase II